MARRLVVGFPADLQVALMFDQEPHPLAEHLMIIDEENLRPRLHRYGFDCVHRAFCGLPWQSWWHPFFRGS